MNPEIAYGRKEFQNSQDQGGSQDRLAGGNSTKTVETMSAFSDFRLGSVS